MANVDFLSVDSWTEDDLDNLPKQEDEIHEFKSSQTKIPDGLNEKICKAASAFWNSGGGYFIVGVDDFGEVDGGIQPKVNKTPLRDWVDQILFKNVHPLGKYAVQLIEPRKSGSRIKPGLVVLAIGFAESADPPHMYENKYFVRAGALSESATHYIVEALRSRRGLYAPMLRAIVRYNPVQPLRIDLGILSVNDSDALDVKVKFDRIPKFLEKLAIGGEFSRTIPVINRENSFYMEISWAVEVEKEPMVVRLEYSDIAGRNYTEEQAIDILASLSPIQPPDDRNVKVIEKALKDVSKDIRRLAAALEARERRNSDEE